MRAGVLKHKVRSFGTRVCDEHFSYLMAIVLLSVMLCLLSCNTREDPPPTSPDPADDDDDDDTTDAVAGAQYHPTWPDIETETGETTIDAPEGATDNDSTVSTDFASSIEFLFSGENPPQIGVDEGTMQPYRVAVLRGRVLDRDGYGIPDVEIAILGHDEYGYTLSRADGGFDIAVNGGGLVSVRYTADGYPPVQRKVRVPWRDYTWLPDVVLTPYDGEVTEINLDVPSEIQVARGSYLDDGDGGRQATLMVLPGTEASLIHEDGTEEALLTGHMRATEFTEGDKGPEAMPGDLPPTSAFTYAVDLSLDEAVDAGAVEVAFSEPVIFYVENFLDFPAGIPVPTGYFDDRAGMWVPSENGLIIEILTIDGGSAEIDIDGDGEAANSEALEELGITVDELEELAGLYSAGQTLWRVPVGHFSEWDLNWGWGPPDDAVPPADDGSGNGGGGGDDDDDDEQSDNGPDDEDDKEKDKPCETDGSIIECQNQLLGQSVPITGTPFSLNYRSNRFPGWIAGKTMNIQLTSPDPPQSLEHILLDITVAGRLYEYEFERESDLRYFFDEWDGYDSYGRLTQGAVPVEVRIGFMYQGSYQQTGAFGYNGNGVEITGDPARNEVTLWSTWRTTMGIMEAGAAGLGGWSISPHHAYDINGETVYLGDGRRQDAGDVQGRVISTIAGTPGLDGFSGDGGPAIDALLDGPTSLTVDADGSLYFFDGGNQRIRQIDPDGVIRTIAGDGTYSGVSLNGDELATEGYVYASNGITVGVDGWMYGASASYGDDNYTWGIDPDGYVHLIAKRYTSAFFDDGGPEYLDAMSDIVASPDGELFCSSGLYVRRIGTDGVVYTLAGNGMDDSTGDGGQALDAAIRPLSLAIDSGSRAYARDYVGNTVRRIDAQGIITTVAGNGQGGWDEDCLGGWATDCTFSPHYLDIGPDDTLYVATHNQVLNINLQGTVSRVAGCDGCPQGEWATDGLDYSLVDIAVGPDGTLYLAGSSGDRIDAVRNPFPTVSGAETIVAAEGGRELFVFDAEGRHLRTLHALTGAVRYVFTYDGDGSLVEIIDGDGNVTTIERDGNGDPTTIVAPGEQRTELGINAYGYLTSIENPQGKDFEFTYHAGGLLEDFTRPTGDSSHYTYDSRGYLTLAEDAAGGFKTLTRTDLASGREIVVETALGRQRSYTVETMSTGDSRSTYTSPNGATNETIRTTNGVQTTTYASGMVVQTIEGPDPRWGMYTPVTEAVSVTTPGGLNAQIEFDTEVGLSDPDDLFSLEWIRRNGTINGRTFTSTYDVGTSMVTSTSAEGRQTSVWVDEQGRPLEIDVDPAVELSSLEYDTLGRLELVTQGDMSVEMAYDARNRLISATNALGQETSWDHDDADRVIRTTLPSGLAYDFEYDENGNLEAITMPSGDVHELGYTVLDQAQSYTPPDSNDSYLNTYDLDRSLTTIALPSGRTLDISHETVGDRLVELDYDEGTVNWDYDDNTRQVSTITHTPAGVGIPQELAFEYDGALLTSKLWSGLTNGGFYYTYDDDLIVTDIVVTIGADSTTISLDHNDDRLLIEYGPFTFTRNGPAGAVDAMLDGTQDVIYNHDGMGRPAQRIHTVAGTETYDIEFIYDDAGRISQKTETIAGVSHAYDYTYDDDGQLIEVLQDGQLFESYGYDVNSNRTFPAAAYDSQDRLMTLDGVAYQFDNDGFMTNRGPDLFEYSTRGELLQATVGAETAYYTYDGMARRVSRTDDNGTLQYYYGNPSMPFQLTATRDGQNEMTVYYYDTAGHLVAFQRGNPWASADWYYVASDQVGTPKVVTDASGVVVKALEYDSWGVLLADNNPGFSLPVGFAGGLGDNLSGLFRFGFRDYEPKAGRWTAKDPILFNGGQFNFYLYTRGDPVNWVDSTGLVPGKHYDTMDEAAYAALDEILPTSIAEDTEYAGYIYANEDGTFSHTAPEAGWRNSFELNYPRHLDVCATYHTHGDGSSYSEELFSPKDKAESKRMKIPYYLGTPSEAIKRYDPVTERQTLLRRPLHPNYLLGD